MMLRMLDLFSGIGGFSLAASWTGQIETVGFCEIEPFCQKVLRKHWPDVPIFPDIKELRGGDIGPVDIVCGGFPCQPFSCAGKQRGKEDDRYLWPEMLRVIAETKPTWIVGENVANIVNMALDTVLFDLEAQGFTTLPLIIPACGVGAPHRRERVWILAHAKHDGRTASKVKRSGHEAIRKESTGEDNSLDIEGTGIPALMADTDKQRLERYNDRSRSAKQAKTVRADIRPEGIFLGGEWWATEPDVGGSHDGLSLGMDGGRLDGTSKKTGTREILHNLRDRIGAETIQRETGRLQGISEEELLQLNLCQYPTDANNSGVKIQSGEIPKKCLQCLRFDGKSPCPSYQRGYNGQPAGKHSNALRFLPCDTPSFYPEAWADGSWEDGVPRVGSGVSARVDRLRSLGNAIVPQVTHEIFKAIVEIEQGG